MKCSKCGQLNDGSCKFYKQTESGTHGRKEWIVCENCSNCSNCGGNKATNGMWCSQNCQWGREKKLCKNCITEHQQQVEEHRKNCPIKIAIERPNTSKTINTEENIQNSPCQKNNTKINLGPDYNTLKPIQQEGRQKTQASWTNKKQTFFIHLECDKLFAFDQTIESYYEAREKAQKQLHAHKKNCQANNSQNNWEKERKSKGIIFITCQKCWGKIRLDKNISDYKTAKQQALSDRKYHQERECTLNPNQRTIAIYHSPNQGGNQHAPLDNSLTDDDNFLQRETEGLNSNPKQPLVILGGIVFGTLGIIGLIVYLVIKNKAKNRESKSIE